MPNEMCVMDRTGDTKTLWNPDNADEVEAAEATFKKLKAKGYLAYSVSKDGEKNEALAAFDKSLGKIILSPPVRGG